MGFDPNLIVDMVELDQPVVGAVYPKRKLDLSKYEKAIAAGDAPSRARAKAHDFTVRGPGVGAHKGFIRVEGCGAGILLLRRDCIATLLERQSQLSDASARLTSPIAHGLDRLMRAFDPIRFENAYLSEDYAFCYRWRLCGGDVWAAADREIVHIGLHRFADRYSDQWPAREAAPGPASVMSLPASEPGPEDSGRPTPRIVVRQAKHG
jgi:hypothetical protein